MFVTVSHFHTCLIFQAMLELTQVEAITGCHSFGRLPPMPRVEVTDSADTLAFCRIERTAAVESFMIPASEISK